MQYLGDFPTSATVYVMFNTYSSDNPSASMTITGLALADIKIYKNGGTTERASTSGYTLLDTDGIDFDGLTGIHGFSIDTSDNTDTGFYAAGNEYHVVVSSVTLDAATVSFVAGLFSIERSGGALALLKNGTYGLAALDTDLGNIETDTADIQTQVGTAGAGLTAVPWNAAWDAEVQSECNDALVAYNAVATTDLPTNFADMAITVTTGQVTVGTNNDKTGYSISGTKTTLDALNDIAATAVVSAGAITTSGGSVSTVTAVTNQVTADMTAISGDTIAANNAEAAFDGTGYGFTNCTIPTVTTLTGHTAQTGDTYALANGAAGFVAIDTVVDAILVDTNELQGDWVNGGRLDLILDARASQTTANAIETDTQDIQSRLPAALVTGKMDSDATSISGSATAADNLEVSALTMQVCLVDTVVNTHTPTTTEFQSDTITEATADHYIGRVVVFTTGVLAYQASRITDYAAVGGIGQFTVEAMTEAPANNNQFVII